MFSFRVATGEKPQEGQDKVPIRRGPRMRPRASRYKGVQAGISRGQGANEVRESEVSKCTRAFKVYQSFRSEETS